MDKISRFFEFLGQHDALIPYILNFNKGPFSEFVMSYDPEDFIICAFAWSDTPQGFFYWLRLSDIWIDELHSLNS